jgi:hypothetical protein
MLFWFCKNIFNTLFILFTLFVMKNLF